MRINEISKTMWDSVVSYMDDDIRETVHTELAPCTNEEFLQEDFDIDL